MSVVKCPNCEDEFINPSNPENGQKLCSSCRCRIQHKMNEIDREYTMKNKKNLSDKQYSEKFKRMHGKRKRRIDHLLKGIPPNAIPSKLAQMAEEIKDPDIKDRSFCIGRIDEVKRTSNGIKLKERYDPHK